MDIFLKKRLGVWSLIFLIMLNLAILISFLFFTNKNRSETKATCSSSGCGNQAMSTELGLTPVQSEKVVKINADYRANAEPVSLKIKDLRNEILTQLESASPDTIVLKRITDTLGELQKEIQHSNIRQYLELKKVCTPEQALRLSALYRNLYGCPMQGNQIRQRFQHRYGKDKKDSNCCN